MLRLGLPGCGWFSTFNASKRTCRLFDSDMRKVLPRFASNRQNPGPITVLFPRFPFFPGCGCCRSNISVRPVGAPFRSVSEYEPGVPGATIIANAFKLQRTDLGPEGGLSPLRFCRPVTFKH